MTRFWKPFHLPYVPAGSRVWPSAGLEHPQPPTLRARPTDPAFRSSPSSASPGLPAALLSSSLRLQPRGQPVVGRLPALASPQTLCQPRMALLLVTVATVAVATLDKFQMRGEAGNARTRCCAQDEVLLG